MELQQLIESRIQELKSKILEDSIGFISTGNIRISERINENGRVIMELERILRNGITRKD